MTLLLCLLSFLPTIDGQRGWTYETTPYWLGVSIPPEEHVYLSAVQLDKVLFDGITSGTHFELSWIDRNEPITFYNYGQPAGQVVPELTLTAPLLLLWGLRRMK